MSATTKAGVTPAAIGKPDGLLAKHKLLRAVIDAPWATGLDHKVAIRKAIGFNAANNDDLKGTTLNAIVSKGGRIKYDAADVPVAA